MINEEKLGKLEKQIAEEILRKEQGYYLRLLMGPDGNVSASTAGNIMEMIDGLAFLLDTIADENEDLTFGAILGLLQDCHEAHLLEGMYGDEDDDEYDEEKCNSCEDRETCSVYQEHPRLKR